jgi:hypothetical protein
MRDVLLGMNRVSPAWSQTAVVAADSYEVS